jgi:hypothetical protein
VVAVSAVGDHVDVDVAGQAQQVLDDTSYELLERHRISRRQSRHK